MARDVQDTLRDVLRAVEHVGGGNGRGRSGSSLSGVKGVAAGAGAAAGAAALVPLAVKGASRLVKGIGADGLGEVVHSPQDALHGVTSKLGDHVGNTISDKVDEAGGVKGIAKHTIGDALPFGGGGDDKGGGGKGGTPGVGKGRRMPVQQEVEIGVNIETVYNQFTQFEEWPNFMHRVTRVTQDEENKVKFATKIWGKTKEFTAEIETQRPDERIKWNVSEGLTHTGVVTFHERGPHLTLLLLTMDVQPGSLIEKAARGMRHVKRAARADLHRFKAFIEMSEQETGAWRGVIEDGEVVEEHDPEYDSNREYADIEDLTGDQDEDENEDSDEETDEETGEETDEETDEEPQPARRGRGQSRSTSSRGTGSRSRNAHSGGSSRSRAAASGGQGRRSQSRSRNGRSE